MKKFYSLLMAVVLMAVGSLSINAATQEVATKMTYVNGGATTESYGVVTSAQTGFNKISGGAVALGNSAWGANNVIFIQVDASAVTSDITKVTLSMESSGSTDSKRTAGIGVGYNSSAWSETLTWDTADRSITTLGNQQWTATKSAAVFEAMSFDITEAFKDDADKVVTILVYNTQAAGNNIQNVKAEVEYTKPDEVLVNYSFNDAENPVVTIAGSRTTADYTTDSPISDGKFLNLWTANQGAAHEASFTVASTDVTTNGQWTLEYDWAVYDGCNKNAGSSKLYGPENEVVFNISNPADWKTSATVTLLNGSTVNIPIYGCDGSTRGSAKTATALTAAYWKHVTVVGTANGVTLTIQAYDAEGKLSEDYILKNGKVYEKNINPSKLGLTPGRMGSVAIDNLKLTVGDLKIVSHDYTVKFVDQNGDAVKADEVRNAVDGEVLAVTDADKETIIEGKTQYTYVSDDAGDRVIDADDMVLTVTYNKTTVTDYTVNFFDASSNPIKDAVTHKNVVVGTEVSATSGETSMLLIDGTFFEYKSGNEPITLVEDAAANVINLVFAPVEGVTGYFFNSYENRAVDWTEYINGKTGSGRYDPVVVDGSTIADRATTEKKPVLNPETGEPVTDPETGEPKYEDVPGLDIPFGNKTYFLGVNQAQRFANGGSVLKNNALAVNQADFTFEAKVLLGSANETNQNLTSFTIRNFAGDANILSVVSARTNEDANLWVINNDAENLTVTLPNSGVFTGTDNSNYSNYSWYNFKVTVYNALTFLTITDTDGNVILDKKQIPTLATSYGIGEMEANMGRQYANFAIDDVAVRSVVVSEDVPAGMEFVAVKINYVDEAKNVLKPADEAKFQVGQPIVLNSAFVADFKVDAEGNVWTAESESAPVTKYIYVSDNSADVPAALGAQVNVVFRGVAPGGIAFRYQIQKTDGTITTKDDAGNNLPLFYASKKAGDIVFEKDVLTYYFPYYLIVDGLLYKTNDNNQRTDGHGTIEIGEGTSTKTTTPVLWVPAMETVPVIDPETGEPALDPETQQPITEEVQISNAVFAEETENIEGITVVKDGYTSGRMANGAAGSAIGGNVFVTTLEPGTYTLTTATRSGTTNFKAAGNVVATVTSGGVVTTVTSPEFTVDQATDLFIEQQASTTQYSDYVLIRKTAELKSYKITLNMNATEYGVVNVPASAAAGATITPVFTPAPGYQVESYEIAVVDAEGAPVTVLDGSFIMPESDVTVTASAVFVPKKIYINTDLTADFDALTVNTNWKTLPGGTAGYTATQFCPAVTTNAGKTVQVCEYYKDACTETGDVLTQTVNGLTPGTYKIELYGGAAFTFGRGFGSMAFTGEIGTGDAWGTHVSETYQAGDKIEPSVENPTGVSLQAKTSEGTYGGEIPIYYATNFPDGAAVVTIDGVEVGQNGVLTIGMSKTSQSTNWHVIQLKGVTAQVLASDLLAKSVAKIAGYTEDDLTPEMFSVVQEALVTYNKAYDTAEEYLTAIAAIDAVAEAALPVAELVKNTKAVEGATYANPVETAFVVNGTFDNSIAPWVTTTGAQNSALASNQQGAFTVPFWENWNPDPYTGKMYQTIKNIPNGVYTLKIAAFVNNFAGDNQASQYVYANEFKTYLTTGEPTAYEVKDVVVTDNTLEIGFEQTEAVANWAGIDNVSLLYHGASLPFEITVVPSENGSLVLPAKAGAGETVAIVANPAVGYELASVMITGVNTNIAVPVDVDEWTGELSFTMPEDDVTVTATFQEAYVKLSDYAVTVNPEFVYDAEFGDEIVATVTYSSEIVGSYAESFALNADFTFEVKDAEGKVVASGTKNPLNVSDDKVTIYIDGLAANTTYTINITGVEVTDFDLATFESVVVFKEVVGLDGNPLATATFTTGLPTGIEAAPAAEEGVKADGKYFENGKIVIYKNGNKYDVSGAPLNK